MKDSTLFALKMSPVEILSVRSMFLTSYLAVVFGIKVLTATYVSLKNLSTH